MNSELKRRLEKDVRESRLKIKIVEKASTSVKRLLQRSNPFKKEPCLQSDCLVCQTGGRGNCRTDSITYELQCKECGDKYIGETGRNAYTRGKEHLMALDSKSDSSTIVRHCMEKHDNIIKDFTMNITGSFQDDSISRQIAESVKIQRNHIKIINNKTEWNFFKIPRASII